MIDWRGLAHTDWRTLGLCAVAFAVELGVCGGIGMALIRLSSRG